MTRTLFMELIKEFSDKDKRLYSYIFCNWLLMILKAVFFTNLFKLLVGDLNAILTYLRLIVLGWVLICTVNYIKTRIENIVFPEFLSFIKYRLFEILLFDDNINEKDTTGEFIKIADYAKNIKDLLIWITNTLIPIVLFSFFSVFYYLYKDPQTTLVVLGEIIINILVFRKYFPLLLDHAVEREQSYIRTIEKMSEKINNIFNIRITNTEKEILEECKQTEQEHVDIHIVNNKKIDNFITKYRVITYSITLIMFIIVYIQSKKNKNYDPINILILRTYYISNFENLAGDVSYYLSVYSSLKNLEDSFKFKPKNLDQQQLLLDGVKQIQFKNFNLKFGDKQLITNFTFEINKGDKVGIKGKSGAGKSSLIKSMLGFYSTDSIFINDIPVSVLGTKNICEKINYVNQSTRLFNKTIIDNILFGTNKDKEHGLRLITKYGLLDNFGGNPENLDGMVVNGGVNISLGMQKIIFLLRGVLKESDVYVFDEPLTSLDENTQNKVMDMINNELGKKTVIIITHHPKILRMVNKIIDLNNY